MTYVLGNSGSDGIEVDKFLKGDFWDEERIEIGLKPSRLHCGPLQLPSPPTWGKNPKPVEANTGHASDLVANETNNAKC